MNDDWTFLANVSDCPPGHGMELAVHGQVIALYHGDNGFHALDGVCPHQGGPLGKGTLRGTIVTCPWHGWQFDVRDGHCLLSPAIRQPSIEVRVVEGRVFARLTKND